MSENVEQPGKLSITWLELILIGLFVSGGMGLWMFTKNQVMPWLADRSLISNKPQTEIYELNASIPALERSVDGSKTYLSLLYEQQISLREQERQAKTTQEILLLEYPILSTLAITDIIEFDIKSIQDYRSTKQDVDVLTALVYKLDTAVTQLISTTAMLSIAVDTSEPDTVSYESNVLRHTQSKAELEAYQEQLIAAHSKYLEMHAQMESLAQQTTASAGQLGSLDSLSIAQIDDFHTYQKSLQDRAAYEITSSKLDDEIAFTESTLYSQIIALHQGRMAAKIELQKAERYTGMERLLWTFGIVVVSLLIFLLISIGIIHIFLKNWNIRIWSVIGMTVGLFAILFAYEILGVLGAGVAGVAVLFLTLVAVNAQTH